LGITRWVNRGSDRGNVELPREEGLKLRAGIENLSVANLRSGNKERKGRETPPRLCTSASGSWGGKRWLKEEGNTIYLTQHKEGDAFSRVSAQGQRAEKEKEKKACGVKEQNGLQRESEEVCAQYMRAAPYARSRK